MMSAPAVGPIGRKILTSIHTLANQKVVDLSAWHVDAGDRSCSAGRLATASQPEAST